MVNKDSKSILPNGKDGKSILPNGKKAIELDMLAWWLIGIAVLVIGVIVYFILTGKLTGGIEFIKNLFRFGAG